MNSSLSKTNKDWLQLNSWEKHVRNIIREVKNGNI